MVLCTMQDNFELKLDNECRTFILHRTQGFTCTLRFVMTLYKCPGNPYYN